MNIQKRWGRLRGIWILILLGAVLSVLLSMDGSEMGKTPGKEAPLSEWGISPLDSPEPLAVIRETELALNQPDLPVRDLWDIGRRLLPNVDASFQTSQRTSREYQLGDEAEFWVGSGILFATALAVLTAVTLATPPESRAVLTRFYERCRPPAGWKAIRAAAALPPPADPPLRRMIFDSLLGMLACLGLVTATNAVFTGGIPACALGLLGAAGCSAWLLARLSGQGKKT